MKQIPTIEQIECVIRRMTRVAPRGDLVLADYSERELAIAIRDLFKGTAFDDVRTIIVHSTRADEHKKPVANDKHLA